MDRELGGSMPLLFVFARREKVVPAECIVGNVSSRKQAQSKLADPRSVRTHENGFS
jgi:hypothetical protein